MSLRAHIQRESRDNFLNTFAKLFDLRDREVRGDNNKFVARITRQEIILAQLAVHQVCDFAQHAISDLVSERVVNQFEAVEIQHDHLERMVGTSGPRDLFLEPKLQTTSVWQTRKLIGQRV